MTIGRKFGHTARRSHKFHIKCDIVNNILFCIQCTKPQVQVRHVK